MTVGPAYNCKWNGGWDEDPLIRDLPSHPFPSVWNQAEWKWWWPLFSKNVSPAKSKCTLPGHTIYFCHHRYIYCWTFKNVDDLRGICVKPKGYEFLSAWKLHVWDPWAWTEDIRQSPAAFSQPAVARTVLWSNGQRFSPCLCQMTLCHVAFHRVSLS